MVAHHKGWRILIASSNEEWADALALLEAVYVGEGFSASEIAQRLFSRSRLEDQGDLLLAVTSAGEVLGVVFLVKPDSNLTEVALCNEAEFRLLAVKPSARRKGIGRALVGECLNRAASRGAKRLVLSTQPAQVAAHVLYGQIGFRRQPERDWRTTTGGIRWVYSVQLL